MPGFLDRESPSLQRGEDVNRFRRRSTFSDRGLSDVVRTASPAGRKPDQQDRLPYFPASP